MKEKIYKFLEKIIYWYWWNKKLFDKKIEVLSENFKVINERTYNTSIAFRSTFWTIIWWTIAFLWLFSKENISDDIKFWLIIFIISWIVWLIFSYLLDFFVLVATQKYINEKQKEFITYRDKIRKFLFWKKEFNEVNNLKFKLPWSKPFVIIVYWISWLLLFFSIFSLIFALIKIGLNYNTLLWK